MVQRAGGPGASSSSPAPLHAPEEVPSFRVHMVSSSRLRDRLMAEGAFKQSERWPGWLELAHDVTCTRPSQGIEILLGSSANGLSQWKSQDGRPPGEFVGRRALGAAGAWLVRGPSVRGVDLVQRVWLPKGLVSLPATRLRALRTPDDDGPAPALSLDEMLRTVEEDYPDAETYRSRPSRPIVLYGLLTRGARNQPAWSPNRLNARYVPALRLAEIILRGGSVEHDVGALGVDGFLFDMAKIFEDSITVAIREQLTADAGGSGGAVKLQARHHLDEADTVLLKADLVWYDASRRPLAVIDAKYKAEMPDGFPGADLSQLLVYCTALGLSEGHLIYAKGNAADADHVVRRAGIRVHQHALDLQQPPIRSSPNSPRSPAAAKDPLGRRRPASTTAEPWTAREGRGRNRER
jgi:hypothetical protein